MKLNIYLFFFSNIWSANIYWIEIQQLFIHKYFNTDQKNFKMPGSYRWGNFFGFVSHSYCPFALSFRVVAEVNKHATNVQMCQKKKENTKECVGVGARRQGCVCLCKGEIEEEADRMNSAFLH